MSCSGYCGIVTINGLPLVIKENFIYFDNYYSYWGKQQPQIFAAYIVFSADVTYGIGEYKQSAKGKKVKFNLNGSIGGQGKYYQHYLTGSQNIFGTYGFVVPYPANGCTDETGHIEWKVGIGDKTFGYVKYHPNGPFPDELVRLPKEPHSQFSLVNCSVSAWQGIKTVETPAYFAFVVSAPHYSEDPILQQKFGNISFADASMAELGEPDPALIDAITGLGKMSIKTTSESNSIQETLDPNYKFPDIQISPPIQYGWSIYGDGFYTLLDGNMFGKSNRFFAHNLQEISDPNEVKSYLSLNSPYCYVKTINVPNAINYNSKGYTAFACAVNNNNEIYNSFPIFMTVLKKTSNTVTFISDYFYAVDYTSTGVRYDKHGNKFVCVPAIEDGNIVINPISPSNYGDFNNDRKVNLIDFAKFSEYFGKTTQDSDFDSMYDFNNNGKVDLSDFVRFQMNWLNDKTFGIFIKEIVINY
jgi:hypothetical protein